MHFFYFTQYETRLTSCCGLGVDNHTEMIVIAQSFKAARAGQNVILDNTANSVCFALIGDADTMQAYDDMQKILAM